MTEIERVKLLLRFALESPDLLESKSYVGEALTILEEMREPNDD